MSKLKDMAKAQQTPDTKVTVKEVKHAIKNPDQGQRGVGKVPDKNPSNTPGMSR